MSDSPEQTKQLIVNLIPVGIIYNPSKTRTEIVPNTKVLRIISPEAVCITQHTPIFLLYFSVINALNGVESLSKHMHITSNM